MFKHGQIVDFLTRIIKLFGLFFITTTILIPQHKQMLSFSGEQWYLITLAHSFPFSGPFSGPFSLFWDDLTMLKCCVGNGGAWTLFLGGPPPTPSFLWRGGHVVIWQLGQYLRHRVIVLTHGAMAFAMAHLIVT
jgi:hypothetical protein